MRLVIFNADAGLIAARRRGFFAREGLDVDVALTPNSTEQMRGLITGKWDIASTAFDNILAWSGREGVEIVAVAQVARGVVLPVFVRQEIRDWSNLHGRRLAVDAVDTAYALVLRRILLAHGLDLARGDYELVPVGATGARLESMDRAETFAAIINPPLDGRAEAAGHVRFADHREVLPNYPGGVWAVTRLWSLLHRDDLVSFIRAWRAGVQWANNPTNRQEAIRMIAGEEKLSPKAAAARLEQHPKEGAMDLAGLQSVLDLRIEFGFNPPMGTDLKGYYDLDYYEAAGKA